MSTHHESRITKNNRKNKKAMKALIVSKMKDSCTTAKRLERTNISRKGMEGSLCNITLNC